MSLREYLPSRQFSLIAASLLVAGSLVAAADYAAAPKNDVGSLAVSTGATEGAEEDWQHMLEDVQGGAAFASLPEPISEGEIEDLLDSAKSDNMTSTVARSLLIKLTAARTEGLGGDIPTQDEIVGDALARMETLAPELYTAADLAAVASSPQTLRAYGNEVMGTFGAHAQANSESAFRAFALAVDNNSETEIETLEAISGHYAALARDLARLSVPSTLVPLHLQATNNFLHIAEALGDMRLVQGDPLRGLSGYQRYRSLMSEQARLLTNVAESLRTGGIIFNKEDLGIAWSIFLNS
ncbi:hypothetical protein A2852_00900 [Candidatus Adlerbacteria bacterium RIFCSPHIGHO2_01_FULL_54_23]|uniref:DUF5667 domain-containing protein n=3 Tax=Candidatus Adleribacteriota TaxID=1752736 RepID=A0A1F4Y077_9BACT|nr:MAG: hypothetical protein UY83_C0001G0003 [Candidatus Adlerbacteria bacterium GW2011_GWA1_54_10]KKW36246.1 MAG: hypothetical protein UY84_C0001G0134 [Candidatus Adlerbacteria bacterium GW2011_GWA2_54_12]KKW37558.1 MAG: hypothetical protein UY86_C0006G0003 [Candidatus Adlerbacteria bacterium GW2011_GWB1_54_7]OGC79402.1 MAG: hypothetical protein A2852_00900 [Candidatus Adlerbacteria bacterium RIFCSPHIGHO2_01_FULL_54_23]OGC87380.1 MAG: hypothetical protein A3B33_01850 [Candidatus Adlerbacteria 